MIDLLLQALSLALWLAVPVVGAALLAGVLSSALQTFTAWSDPALTYVPRILAVAVAWGLSAPWIAGEMLDFARLAWGGSG